MRVCFIVAPFTRPKVSGLTHLRERLFSWRSVFLKGSSTTVRSRTKWVIIDCRRKLAYERKLSIRHWLVYNRAAAFSVIQTKKRCKDTHKNATFANILPSYCYVLPVFVLHSPNTHIKTKKDATSQLRPHVFPYYPETFQKSFRYFSEILYLTENTTKRCRLHPRDNAIREFACEHPMFLRHYLSYMTNQSSHFVV